MNTPTRLTPAVVERVRAEASAVYDTPMAGPLIADLMATWAEMPCDVKDFPDAAALPASRVVYDALAEAASQWGVPLRTAVEAVVAHALKRPDLLDSPEAPAVADQGVLPLGDVA